MNHRTALFLLFLTSIACSLVTTSPTVTPTPLGPTSTPLPSDLTLYADPVVGFSFLYPKEAVLTFFADQDYSRLDLPFQPGTNLQEKYLEIRTSANEGGCALREGSEVREAEFNGVQFKVQTGSDEKGAWEKYTATDGIACVNLVFVFRARDPGNYDPPPPVFDLELERAVFEQLLSTFAWAN